MFHECSHRARHVVPDDLIGDEWLPGSSECGDATDDRFAHTTARGGRDCRSSRGRSEGLDERRGSRCTTDETLAGYGRPGTSCEMTYRLLVSHALGERRQARAADGLRF
jgi:hypothetical protein